MTVHFGSNPVSDDRLNPQPILLKKSAAIFKAEKYASEIEILNLRRAFQTESSRRRAEGALSLTQQTAFGENRLFQQNRPFSTGQLLIRRHQHRKGQLDELLVLADGVQGSAHVVGVIGGTTRLYPVGQFKNGSFEGQLVFVDLEKKGREQV